MVSKNFIIGSVIASIASIIIIKIFNPEITEFADKIRLSKPSKNIKIGETA